MRPASLNYLDYAIIFGYFAATLLIGYRLRKRMVSTTAFFLAGRSLPSIVTGIAFVAANCGALEVMGMVSTGAKYGGRGRNGRQARRVLQRRAHKEQARRTPRQKEQQ